MNDGYDEYCRGLIAQAQSEHFDQNDRTAACGCADYLNPMKFFGSKSPNTEREPAEA